MSQGLPPQPALYGQKIIQPATGGGGGVVTPVFDLEKWMNVDTTNQQTPVTVGDSGNIPFKRYKFYLGSGYDLIVTRTSGGIPQVRVASYNKLTNTLDAGSPISLGASSTNVIKCVEAIASQLYFVILQNGDIYYITVSGHSLVGTGLAASGANGALQARPFTGATDAVYDSANKFLIITNHYNSGGGRVHVAIFVWDGFTTLTYNTRSEAAVTSMSTVGVGGLADLVETGLVNCITYGSTPAKAVAWKFTYTATPTISITAGLVLSSNTPDDIRAVYRMADKLWGIEFAYGSTVAYRLVNFNGTPVGLGETETLTGGVQLFRQQDNAGIEYGGKFATVDPRTPLFWLTSDKFGDPSSNDDTRLKIAVGPYHTECLNAVLSGWPGSVSSPGTALDYQCVDLSEDYTFITFVTRGEFYGAIKIQ